MRASSIPMAIAALSLACVALPALAVPGGKIGTMPTGTYICEKPGDATGLVTVRVPDDDFTIRASSSYSVKGVRGSYLLTGNRMVMTGGPFEGRTFQRTSTGYLRKTGPDGEPGDERCVLKLVGMP